MPGEQVGEAFVAIRPDTSGFATEAQRGIAGPLQAALAGISTAVVGRKIGEFFRGAFDEATKAAKVGAQTEAVLKSTGEAAGVSAKHIADYAGELSDLAAIDDDVIQQGENVLLTFTGIRNEVGKGNNIFDQGTKAALNMSVALGTDLQGAVIQVGKALNDPIAGITALSRVGVSFTEQQKEQIATLQKSGDVLGAQKVILRELNKEFGGAAASQATDAARLQVAYGNLKESIGTALLPVVNALAKALQPVAEFLSKNQVAAATLAVVVSGALLAAMTAYTIRAAQATIATLSFSAAEDEAAASGTGMAARLAGGATLVGGLALAFWEAGRALGFYDKISSGVTVTAGELTNHQGRLRRELEDLSGWIIRVNRDLDEQRKFGEQATNSSSGYQAALAQLRDKTADLVGQTEKLARTSPTLAREFVDQARAAGLPEGILRKLNKVIDDQEALNIKAAAAAKKDADALAAQGQSAEDAEKSLRSLNDYINASIDANLNFEEAGLRLDEALRDLWVTFNNGESTLSDQQQALIDTKRRIEEYGKAAFDQNMLVSNSAGEAARAQVASLNEVASRLAPGSPLRVWLDQYIAALTQGIPKETLTDIIARFRLQIAQSSGLTVEDLQFLDASPVLLASGGYVPARPGGTLAVIGEGGQGEYVVPEDQMATAGGVHFHYNELPPDAVEQARVVIRTLDTMRWAYA